MYTIVKDGSVWGGGGGVCVCVSPNIVDKETNGSSDFVCLSFITERGREIGVNYRNKMYY